MENVGITRRLFNVEKGLSEWPRVVSKPYEAPKVLIVFQIGFQYLSAWLAVSLDHNGLEYNQASGQFGGMGG